MNLGFDLLWVSTQCRAHGRAQAVLLLTFWWEHPLAVEWMSKLCYSHMLKKSEALMQNTLGPGRVSCSTWADEARNKKIYSTWFQCFYLFFQLSKTDLWSWLIFICSWTWLLHLCPWVVVAGWGSKEGGYRVQAAFSGFECWLFVDKVEIPLIQVWSFLISKFEILQNPKLFEQYYNRNLHTTKFCFIHQIMKNIV